MNRNLFLAILLTPVILVSCNRARQQSSSKFVIVGADRTTAGPSKYPVAVDLSKVGTYPANVHSGAGYFYDVVLEYRVWLHPDRGAKPLNGEDDYFLAFAQYEPAAGFFKRAPGAEEPIVLVRQVEWISEAEHGHFIPMQEERITEWQVQCLTGNKHGPTSIQEFMKHPREAGP